MYVCDIVVQSDSEGKGDDFTFRSSEWRDWYRDRTWDHFCDMFAMISCPGDSGVGMCTQLCIYAFGDVWIVVYDMGGYDMDMVINRGEVD